MGRESGPGGDPGPGSDQDPRAQGMGTSFFWGSAPQTPLQVGLEASEITGYIPSDTARIVGARDPFIINFKNIAYVSRLCYQI